MAIAVQQSSEHLNAASLADQAGDARN